MSSFSSTLLGALGRTLIALGTLVLLFAAFQYWGTNLAEAQAQDSLDAEFAARLDSFDGGNTDDTGNPGVDDGVAVETGLAGASADAGSSTGTVHHPMLDLADIPRNGDAAGRIRIPAIGVDKTYVQGVGRDDLRKGPGHYPRSPYPGQPGNAAIAGHRTTYGAPFHDLDQLLPGDEIIVETLQGRFTYLVEGHESDEGDTAGHFIVAPTDTWVLDDQGDSRLTLTACHPKRSAAQRIVVTAVLASPPAPITPLPIEADDSGDGELATEEVTGDQAGESFEDTLDWQPQYSGATALWAALTALVAGAGWLAGRRWKPVPAYLIAAGPFLVCLFLCFTFLDKLLPAI